MIEQKTVTGIVTCNTNADKSEFSTKDFTSATRWILYNGDQQVSAFVLPATCRPEGFLSAKKANTLVMVQPNEEKEFSVLTGLK